MVGMGSKQMSEQNVGKLKSYKRSESELEFGRILAFSDAVFAIAMTILVLTITVPNIPDRLVADELPGKIADLWPHLFSYLLSFAVIGVHWIGHHVIFSRIVRYDMRLVAINLAFLCFIALLPFPTELLGEYGDQAISVVIYATNLTILGVLQTWLFVHAIRRGLLRESISDEEEKHWIANLVFKPIIFGASIPIAIFVSPSLAQYSWILLLVLRPFLRRYLSIPDDQDGDDTGSKPANNR